MSCISKITVARLYNVGNYEHVRYELTVEIGESDSASDTIRAIEHILEGMRPVREGVTCKTTNELFHQEARLLEMKRLPAGDGWDREYRNYVGTRDEIIARHEDSLAEEKAKRTKALRVAETARIMFDDLGGASKWTDAKLNWEDDY